MSVVSQPGKLLDLGFYGPGTTPGSRRKRAEDLLWEAACWLLNALGVFAGQAITLKDGVDFDPAHVTLRRFLACMALGVPAFVYFMRKLNSRVDTRGLLHAATPFTCGFLFGKFPVKELGRLRTFLRLP